MAAHLVFCVSLSQSNGKSAVKAESSDDEMEDDSEEDEEDDAEDDDDDDAAMVAKSKSKGAAKPSAAAPAAASAKSKSSSAASPAASPSLSALSTPAIALPAASPLTSLPTPSLSSLSADVGMDQLRQRLHERIHGLSNKRKPEDHPFAKKRQKKPESKDKKKREKNEDRPSSHKNSKPPVFNRDTAGDEAPVAKKAKTNPTAAPTISASSSSSLTSRPSLSASDIADSGDFEFASLKAPELGSVAAGKLGGSGGGSYSLAGKAQRKKHKSDETLLKEVESFEAKVGEMKNAGQGEAARALESERAIQNAILRASGVKVKDDKKLLKASLKRSEKKKEKSRAEWADRTSAAKTTQDAFHADKIARASKKQKGDRSKYVAPGGEGKGKEGGKDKEGDKGEKKGRAGFEGKSKKKFLN